MRLESKSQPDKSPIFNLPTADCQLRLTTPTTGLAGDSYDSNGNTTVSSANSYQYDPLNHVTNVNNGAVLNYVMTEMETG